MRILVVDQARFSPAHLQAQPMAFEDLITAAFARETSYPKPRLIEVTPDLRLPRARLAFCADAQGNAVLWGGHTESN